MRACVLFVTMIVSAGGCSPAQPSRPAHTCLDPRIVAPSKDGKTVGIPDVHGNIHFVPTTLPICRLDELH